MDIYSIKKNSCIDPEHASIPQIFKAIIALQDIYGVDKEIVRLKKILMKLFKKVPEKEGKKIFDGLTYYPNGLCFCNNIEYATMLDEWEAITIVPEPKKVITPEGRTINKRKPNGKIRRYIDIKSEYVLGYHILKYHMNKKYKPLKDHRINLVEAKKKLEAIKLVYKEIQGDEKALGHMGVKTLINDVYETALKVKSLYVYYHEKDNNFYYNLPILSNKEYDDILYILDNNQWSYHVQLSFRKEILRYHKENAIEKQIQIEYCYRSVKDCLDKTIEIFETFVDPLYKIKDENTLIVLNRLGVFSDEELKDLLDKLEETTDPEILDKVEEQEIIICNIQEDCSIDESKVIDIEVEA